MANVFQSLEAERPMNVVIRQEIYEDLKPQSRNEDWCGVYKLRRALFLHDGNSEGAWEGLAAGPVCWKRGVPGLESLP